MANSGMRKKQLEAQDSIISYTQKRVNEPEQEKLDKIRELQKLQDKLRKVMGELQVDQSEHDNLKAILETEDLLRKEEAGKWA